MITNFYQTIPLSTGTIQGLFPTVDWFKSMDVDWKDKVVLDLGCCTGSYGIQVLQEDAAKYIGVDSSVECVETARALFTREDLTNKSIIVHSNIEDYQSERSDIAIFSMIIHWLNNAEHHISRIASSVDTLIFVYRYPQSDFPEEGYLPTFEELDDLLPDFTRLRNQMLSETREQNIALVVYERNI